MRNIMHFNPESIIDELIDKFSIPLLQDALFVVSHSGGKDSQAMYKILKDHPIVKNLIVVHAELPGADWECTLPQIHSTIEHELFTVRAAKTFKEMVQKRGMWPSPKFRTCTSDLKSSPIQKFTRNYAKDHGYSLVFNCMGLRAEESPNRSKKRTIKLNPKISNRKRSGYDLLPIHHFSIDQVLGTYGESLQSLNERRRLYRLGEHQLALKNWPFSEIYVQGMTRHSCKICILANKQDLRTSAILDPKNFNEYIDLEDEVNHSFAFENGHKVSLRDITGLNNQTELFKKAS